MKIKICGLTKPKEAEYLNEVGADYAGFVFYEKSKRNISVEQAGEIFKLLDPSVKKVAVTVSPDREEVERLQMAGFDILQIHKELKREVVECAKLPIWYAVNISSEEELIEKANFFSELSREENAKITALVLDAPMFGSGQTFNWSKSKRLKKAGTTSPPIFEGREFVLAGGLKADNVALGIEIFEPDIVDVSSGVEKEDGLGKDKDKIHAFARAAGKTFE